MDQSSFLSAPFIEPPSRPALARQAAAAPRPAGAAAYRRYWLPDAAVLIGLTAGTILLFQFTSLDLDIAGRFADPPGKERWGLRHEIPWTWLEDYIPLFSTLFGMGAFGAVLLAAWGKRFRRLGLYGMLTLATIAVGPGLTVNLLLKPFWGRERPRNVEAFAGRSPYRHALQPGQPGTGHSFPCGHSSIGFALGVFYFIFRRGRRGLRYGALYAAVGFGLLIGVARVVAGAHFPSDVLWSGLIVFFLAWFLYYFVFNIPAREDAGEAPVQSHPRWAFWLYGGLTLCVCAGGLLAAPVYHHYAYHQDLLAHLPPARVRLSIDRAAVTLQFTAEDAMTIRGTSHGFGLHGSRVHHRLEEGASNDPARWRFELKPDGLFTELKTDLSIRLPRSTPHEVILNLTDVALHIHHASAPPEWLTIRQRGGTATLPESWRKAPARLQVFSGEGLGP